MARIKIENLPTGKGLVRKMMRGIRGGVVCLPEEGGGGVKTPSLVGDDPVFVRNTTTFVALQHPLSRQPR